MISIRLAIAGILASYALVKVDSLPGWYASPLAWLSSPNRSTASNENRYGAVIDAGSSGSRIAIFELRIASSGDPHVWPVVSVEAKDPDHNDCRLSDLPKDEDRICKCLREVTENARGDAIRYLGEPNLPPIALWVKATAGVRYQDSATQAGVLEAADRCLGKSASYDNSSHYEWKGAEVISGAEEGMYAWLAVNHVARTLRNDTPSTLGIVEVGGRSAQIAYRVPGPISPAPTQGEILAVPLPSGTLHIYSLSGQLGKTAAFEGIEAAEKDCALNGNRDACLGAIDTFLCGAGSASKACSDRKPELMPPGDMRFAGLSNFTHVTRNMGLANLTLDAVRARADMICGSSYDANLRDAFLKPAGKYKDRVCFDALYVTQLARDGWGVRLEAVSPPDAQWAADPSWPLGAMIVEALLR